MNKGIKFDDKKPPEHLLAHEVVVHDTAPIKGIEFYAMRLREWWNCAGTLPALELSTADYYGVVAILKHGAEKYSPRNWELGLDYSRVFRAAMKHFAGRGGLDDEPGGTMLPHRHHFLCCYMFLAAYTARGMHEFDDRPRVLERGLIFAPVVDEPVVILTTGEGKVSLLPAPKASSR